MANPDSAHLPDGHSLYYKLVSLWTNIDVD